MEFSLEDTVDVMFNSFNHELKAVIIGFLVDEHPQTAYAMLARGGELTRDAITFRGKSAIQHYFNGEREGNLSPFVYQARGKGQKTPAAFYALNELGIEYGRPIARFLLYNSIKFNLPLQAWLGISQKSGPAAMVHLLTYINENPAARFSDIVENAGLSWRSVELKLEKLTAAGLITVRRFKEEQMIPYVRCGNQQDPGNAHKHPDVARAILQVIPEYDHPFSYQDLLARQDFPFRHIDTIQSTLRSLARKGSIREVTPWHGGERMTEARITERGHDIITDVVDPVIGFLDHHLTSASLVREKEIYLKNLPTAMQLYRSQLRNR